LITPKGHRRTDPSVPQGLAVDKTPNGTASVSERKKHSWNAQCTAYVVIAFPSPFRIKSLIRHLQSALFVTLPSGGLIIRKSRRDLSVTSLRKKLKILESGNFLPDRAGTISIYHYHQMLGLACGKNLSSSSAMVSIRIKSRLGVSGNGAKNPYSPYLGETKIKKYRIWLTLRNRHHCSGSVFGSRDQIISREITFNLTKELEVP
jgi:hypothetical protein